MHTRKSSRLVFILQVFSSIIIISALGFLIATLVLSIDGYKLSRDNVVLLEKTGFRNLQAAHIISNFIVIDGYRRGLSKIDRFKDVTIPDFTKNIGPAMKI